MGFGIMFLGFMLTYLGALTPLYVFTYAIGSIVILFSLKNLIFENKWFLSSAVFTAVLEVVSIAVLVFFAVDSQGKVYDILCMCQTYISFALIVNILVAIYIIAKNVGLVKIQSKVIVDGAVLVIGVLVSELLPMIKTGKIASYVGIIAVFCKLIYTIFTLVIIFNCYMRICYAGDEDMSNPDTGMKFFDVLTSKLNNAIDKGKDINKKGKKK